MRDKYLLKNTRFTPNQTIKISRQADLHSELSTGSVICRAVTDAEKRHRVLVL